MAKTVSPQYFKLFAFVFTSAICSLLLFTLMRIAFYSAFYTGDTITEENISQAFYLGFKFDMRLALLAHLPVLLALLDPIRLFVAKRAKTLWLTYLVIAHATLIFIYFMDFGHYDYLGVRIDATVLRFLLNPVISAGMMWESYPIIWINLSYFLIVFAYFIFIRTLVNKFDSIEICNEQPRRNYVITVILVGLLTFGGIFAKWSQYPLRWSDAFFTPDGFVSSLATNPVIYFYYTFKNRETDYDLEKVEKYYPLIASYLGVEDAENKHLDYTRQRPADNGIANKPNVVMVFLESFGYNKTGLSGNPMNPSPNFDKIANEGLFFDRFYVPHGGTARSVFTAVTGIPDIEPQKSSSRNPLVVNQHTIINSFEDYSKHYFLGGSSSWGNIRGVFSHNIPDINIHEEYDSPRNDSWGISDLHLFEEANKFLREEKEPFFAVIQTSGNHRPYTIPKETRGFEVVNKDADELARVGFRSVDDYNAYRFMDHCIGVYYDLLQKEAYAQNTIFVFFADHGNNREAKHMHKGEDALMLTEYHIPLAIYAPGFIKQPAVISKIGSEVDLLPTIADISGQPYTNTTFGRSLMDEQFDDQRYAFTILVRPNPRLGLISDDYYFLMNADGKSKDLHAIYSDSPKDNLADQEAELTKEYAEITKALFETIKYIRLNNASH